MLRRFSTQRRIVRTLERMAGALEAQVEVLREIRDGVVTEAVRGDEEPGDVGFVDEGEAAVVQGYVARVMRETGRVPTEDEVVAYLADELTMAQVAKR